MNAAPKYHDESMPEVEGYRPMDFGGLAAIAFALPTPMAIVAPMVALLAIPAIGFGLRSQFRSRRDGAVGMLPKVVRGAMVFAAFFAAWGGVSHVTMRSHLESIACERFEEWVGYLARGERFEAYELHLQYQRRQLPGVSLEQLYTTDVDLEMEEMMMRSNKPEDIVRAQMSRPTSNPKMQFEGFFANDPLKTLAERAAEGRLIYDGLQSVEWSGADVDLGLRYHLSYDDPSGTRELPFVVYMRRSRYEGGEYHWMVDELARVTRLE